MNISNTFKALLRPGNNEYEGEKKVEQKESATMTHEPAQEEPIFQPEQTLQSKASYKYLDSDVFTLSTNNVYYAEPRDYEDAEIITEAIEAGKIVIMRLDDLPDGLDKRILDFVSGFCCAFKILPIKTSIETQFLIDPNHRRTKNYR